MRLNTGCTRPQALTVAPPSASLISQKMLAHSSLTATARWNSNHSGSTRAATPAAASVSAAAAAQRPPCTSVSPPSVTLPSAWAVWGSGCSGAVTLVGCRRGVRGCRGAVRPTPGRVCCCTRPRPLTCHVQQHLRVAAQPVTNQPRQQHAVLNEDKIGAARGGRHCQDAVEAVVRGAHPNGALCVCFVCVCLCVLCV